MLMLNVSTNNFGVGPTGINVREFFSGSMLFLVGEIAVDATADEYLAARYLTLTVAGLSFGKSRICAAFAMAEIDGARRISLTSVRIKDGGTVRIDKVPAYESAGSYRVFLSCVLFPENMASETTVSAAVNVCLECVRGGVEDAECFLVDGDGWAMLVFNAAGLNWGEDDKVVMNLEGAEALSAEFVPVIYADSANDAMGSKFYPGSLSGGVLTIERAGAADEPEGSLNKFFRIFIIK